MFTTSTAKVMLCIAAVTGAACVYAQKYPVKPIRIIVPLAPGGGTDTLTRVMNPRLVALLGQQVLVENRPGAATQIGTEFVAKAAPDGYVLLNTDTSLHTNPSLYAKLPYDTLRDFAPVSLLASAPVVLAIHPSVPVTTLKQLIALARARPGELTFAIGGYGTGTHLVAEIFKTAAKINFTIVPYKGGGAAVADTIAGQVVMMFGGPATIKPHVVNGRLRPIAVTGEKRNSAFPNLPTFDESGVPGVDSGSYWGSLAPAATPPDVIATLNTAMKASVQAPDVRARLIDLGYEPLGSTPEEYGALIRSEIARWAKVVKAANIKLE